MDCRTHSGLTPARPTRAKLRTHIWQCIIAAFATVRDIPPGRTTGAIPPRQTNMGGAPVAPNCTWPWVPDTHLRNGAPCQTRKFSRVGGIRLNHLRSPALHGVTLEIDLRVSPD